MKKLLSCVVFAMVACGGGKAAQKTDTTNTSSAATMLTIGEMKFYEGDDLGLKMHADGKVEIKGMHSEGGKPAVEEWKQVGAVSADGKVTASDGKVMAELQADGTMKLADGSVAPFKIDGDALVMGDKKVTIGDKGVFQGTNPGMKPMRVEGITDAGSKKTALLLLGIISTPGKTTNATAQEAAPAKP